MSLRLLGQNVQFKLRKGSNRSARLNKRANVSENVVILGLECQNVKEKRVSSDKFLLKRVTHSTTRAIMIWSVEKAKVVISDERKVAKDGELCMSKSEVKICKLVGRGRGNKWMKIVILQLKDGVKIKNWL
ncbi:hypothetical protein PHJA_002726000 [Phtheirospermum japonicum]|uniref:Uncharacterized protein n=1 Tax=Phtheirospermum japonicum TaxID=374723 RepID=A0A830D7Q8_9LAMI|nr:hypothetical protein PHJA_002726000 [Phtheirospermum japonicum]